MSLTIDKVVINNKGTQNERRGLLRYETIEYYGVAAKNGPEQWLKEGCEIVDYNGYNLSV